MHFFHDLRAQDSAHDMPRHRFASGIRVTSRQIHSGEIIVADLRFFIDHRRRHVHSVFATGRLQKMRRGFVAKSARTKMHADPNAILLIGEKIDIMISATNRSKLVGRHRFQPAHWLQLPGGIVEQLMFNARFTFASNAERNVAHDVVHNFFDREF